jgi:hypothetical protein
MAVPAVFLSSVVTGLEDVRDQAAAGIRSVGMHAIRSEELAADATSPRRALLDEVVACDVYMLLLGERYGDVPTGETSPTEDEYDAAVTSNKEILVLVQNVELEPRQREFLERVRGMWGDGVLVGRFDGANDTRGAVAAALSRRQVGIVEDGPAAQAQAIELARGNERAGTISGVAARIAFVPLRQTTLLDAVALDDPRLGDDLAKAMRAADLAPQSIGISPTLTGGGVQLIGTEPMNWTRPEATIYVNGSIVVVGSVALDDGQFGTMLVGPERLQAFVVASGRFAQLVWDRIDVGEQIGRSAITLAILDAQHKGFGGTASGSMSISMSLPVTVVAPDPAEIVARNQLADEGTAARVVAAIKRVFADAGAVQG